MILTARVHLVSRRYSITALFKNKHVPYITTLNHAKLLHKNEKFLQVNRLQSLWPHYIQLYQRILNTKKGTALSKVLVSDAENFKLLSFIVLKLFNIF
jgi:hypothetical protein